MKVLKSILSSSALLEVVLSAALASLKLESSLLKPESMEYSLSFSDVVKNVRFLASLFKN